MTKGTEAENWTKIVHDTEQVTKALAVDRQVRNRETQKLNQYKAQTGCTDMAEPLETK